MVTSSNIDLLRMQLMHWSPPAIASGRGMVLGGWRSGPLPGLNQGGADPRPPMDCKDAWRGGRRSRTPKGIPFFRSAYCSEAAALAKSALTAADSCVVART